MSDQPECGETVALVTGANRGIGLEVARQLGERGMHVIVTARDEAKAKEAAEALAADGVRATGMVVDVASPESVRALAERVEAEVGRLDGLVNNAAGYVDWAEKASSADLDASRELFETNLWGSWRTTQALLPALQRSRRARIVNVASGAGRTATSRSASPRAVASLPATASPRPRSTASLRNWRPSWSVVWAAVLPDHGPSGGFFRDGQPLPW